MNRKHRLFGRKMSIVGLVVALVALAARGRAESYDAQYLDGLRQRRLYELAEKYCADRLDDEALGDARQAGLTIELSRTLAEHALNASAADAPALWQRARQVPDRFADRHARSPQLLLVRLQGQLALAAQGEAARQVASDQDDVQATGDARAVLREAIAGLEALDGQIADQLRQSRAPASRDGLSTAELQSLQMNVQLELARTLRNQALCYPEGSPDRINALVRAGEALSAVMRPNERSMLTWSAELEEVARQRLLGEYSTAARKLDELDKTQPPPSIAQQIRAERMRLALARDRVDDALAEAGTAANMPHGPEVDFARLETLLAAAHRARERRQAERSAEWQSRAVQQAQAIGRTYGAHWMRRAESLLARSVASADGPQTADTLSFAAAGYYRGGQFDKAIAAFDEAARKAREAKHSKPAFDAAYSAATIEKERGNFREALERYRRLALDAKDEDRAAAAHLLAIYCAAQLAQASRPPNLDQYETLLREHVDTWPSAATSAQAYSWLGRLDEHRGAWQAAIDWLVRVRPGNPQYAEAVAAIGRCYEGWLGELHARDQDGQRLANDALAALEGITGNARPNDATRAATLSAARIWLLELPNGAVPAERLLRGGLETDASAPPGWQTEARRWLVPALAMQGKGGQVDQVLDAIRSSPAETLAVLAALAAVRERHAGDEARKLAQMELDIENRQLNRASRTRRRYASCGAPPSGDHAGGNRPAQTGAHRLAEPGPRIPSRWTDSRRHGPTAGRRQRRRRARGIDRLDRSGPQEPPRHGPLVPRVLRAGRHATEVGPAERGAGHAASRGPAFPRARRPANAAAFREAVGRSRWRLVAASDRGRVLGDRWSLRSRSRWFASL